ncbi:hypothetical protein FBEOM_12546 [Fusarium beomiforme]|uniref:Uncharacterized protein n=1 Tax=Fusarium beomiforme TaxID=44412 RepID=A0A9P5DPI4_9HYPO|nr:hypothetical protein FBEOM_12546 [Fusarium beomiforme]
MDDPASTWPAWKFDMKREDLSTNLHDQYNTYLAPIQSPEAFYHDISEIAHTAHSVEEFHHLAHDRRQQRLDELNQALESASFEIIGNPNLIETPQWEHAIRLFQSNSLDSLVRYFASYLPYDHRWRPLPQDSALSDADSRDTLRRVTGRKPLAANETSQLNIQTLPSTPTKLQSSRISGSRTREMNESLQTSQITAFNPSEESTMKAAQPQMHTSSATRKESQVSAGAVLSNSSTVETVKRSGGEMHGETAGKTARPCINLSSTRAAFECIHSRSQGRQSFHYHKKPKRTSMRPSTNSPPPSDLGFLAVPGENVGIEHRSGIDLKRKRS